MSFLLTNEITSISEPKGLTIERTLRWSYLTAARVAA